MRFIYNIGILLYYMGAYIASFFNEKAKKFVEGRKNIFSKIKERIAYNDKFIWMHVASLGEFEQGRPLIELIKKRHPEYKILLTFFSPSGYEVRKDYDKADIITYLPMDTSWNAKKFIQIVNPAITIFIKYEFWGNYLSELKKNQIPTYAVSAIFREQQVFFKWYGGWYRSFLKNFRHLFVQDSNSKNLLSSIGFKNVSIVGDTRFDRVLAIAKESNDLPLIEAFATEDRTLVAGSTWPNDEDVILPYFNTHKELKLIIAPHEIHESHIESIISKLERPYIRYTQATEEQVKQSDCIIIDCIGLLSSIYKYGNVAYIGGGFGVGIHNILEAAVYGMPVIFGHNYHKFREAVEMVKSGSAFPISNKEEFDKTMNDFYSKNSDSLEKAASQAKIFVANNSGASEKVMEAIFQDSNDKE